MGNVIILQVFYSCSSYLSSLFPLYAVRYVNPCKQCKHPDTAKTRGFIQGKTEQNCNDRTNNYHRMLYFYPYTAFASAMVSGRWIPRVSGKKSPSKPATIATRPIKIAGRYGCTEAWMQTFRSQIMQRSIHLCLVQILELSKLCVCSTCTKH